MYTLEALKGKYDLTFITFSQVNLQELNSYYGTQLAPGEFSIVQLRYPKLLGWLLKVMKFDILRQSLAMRYCKRFYPQFDLMIGTCNEMDFGGKGIQYIHFPSLAEDLIQVNPIPRWYYQDTLFRRGYLKLCKLVAGFSTKRMKSNITLVNSNWTGKMTKKAYDIESRTVYPPVLADFPNIPWEKREDGFVCIGRIFPAKRIEKIIEILRQILEKGFDIHLHIIGNPQDPKYVAKLEQLCKENSGWAFLEGALPRKELVKIIAKHKFGIHGMEHEHFGIVLAEMVKAGCIVFVPDGGGQVEIINDPMLRYSSIAEAVRKITAVLRDDGLQASLQGKLSLHVQRFSVESFIADIRQVVEEFFAASE